MHAVGFKRSILGILIGTVCSQSMASSDNGQPMQNDDAPCAQHTKQIAGAVIGAAFGLLLGKQVGKGNGQKAAMAIGALSGLALGNYVGSEMDRRKCELSKIATKNNLKMVVSDLNLPAEQALSSDRRVTGGSDQRVGMSVAIEDDASSANISNVSGGEVMGNAASSTQFESGSNALSPKAAAYFREITIQYAVPFRADAIQQGASQDQINAIQGLRQKRLLILGHTDDTGSSRMNADLSEQRAKSVARLFTEAGVPISQVYYQGSGETQPVADNRTEEGRAKNRRVEIVDLTDEVAFEKYLSSRTTNANFYRISPVVTKPELDRADLAATGDGKVVKVESSHTVARDSKVKAAQVANAGAASIVANVSKSKVASGFDFGGKAVGSEPASIDIGKLVTSKSVFNFISPANADDLPMARSCSEDHPRVANAVKSLESNQEYHVSEYLPNLYDTSWTDRVNGNLVALTHVAVLRDGAAPVKKPTVLIYKSSGGKLAGNAKADYSAVADVNTYQGETALLYRVFSDGPIKCMDVVIPRDHPSQAAHSALYYQVAGTRMVAAFNPTIAK